MQDAGEVPRLGAAPRKRRLALGALLVKYGVLGILLLLIVFLSIAAPAFLTFANWRYLLQDMAVATLVALGVTISVVVNGFDVSVGANAVMVVVKVAIVILFIVLAFTGFDSGNLEPGQTFSFTFSEAGTYVLRLTADDGDLTASDDVTVTAEDLLAWPEGPITEAGLRTNVSVALQYLEAWLQGSGAVPIFHLMEDAATAEISRSQVWQWLRHGKVERDDVEHALAAESAELGPEYDEARALFDFIAKVAPTEATVLVTGESGAGKERVAQAGPPPPYPRNPIGYGMGGPTVFTHGSEAQRDRYLRPLFTGEEVWCQLFSEPGAGSDLANLSTRAERDGDEDADDVGAAAAKTARHDR